ncbi:hypothetical protein GOZ90_22400 [Agrobacterium vitis]|uniref:PSK operon transcription factor n=1 Tax=Agrobacterium vitis TaxID=373 RepID=A0A6L6VK29_AGRVI|nr:type II toxin-antitoxin system VapB family antitoxin [Agrobacterium vitis]MUZ75431.1 hypothetical protein [Agrobacterium vitis]
MLQIAPDTEHLARKVAARLGRKPEDVIRTAIEREAKALGVTGEPAERKRITATEILEFGKRAAARPVLDSRSPQEIVDDINAL